MKQKLSSLLLLIGAVALISTSTGCKKKPKDADIKAAVEAALKADPSAASTMVADVKDGVVTITGECKDDACKANCEKMVAAVKNVKSVVNNCTVMPPVVINPDDVLSKKLTDALASFPGVTGTVKEGAIMLGGEIKKADLAKLMMALNALNPKKVDNTGLVKK
jgi:hyperosmotically inducible periplasmic protein